MRIGLLGTLQVRDDSGDPVRVGGHRVRSLLILLALEPGRVVAATSLIGRLWPDDAPGDAGNALQTLVSRLRTALRGTGVIESHPVGYRLVIDPGDVDSIAFETLVRQATGPASNGATDPALAASLLREALALWRGPALADVADEEFARGPATRLEEARLAALHDRIEAELALGESASLIGELRSLVTANPLAERSRVLLMRALQADGRQADALAVYTEARELLATELGVDPSPDLERAHLDVLRQNFSPKRRPADPPAARESPAVRKPRASFVGRDDDLSGVRDRLGEHWLVTLTGPGGIGKTRLAAEVTAALDDVAVHTAELARVTAGAEVPFAVLDAIVGRERSIARGKGEPVPVSDPLQRISAALADRDALVVLDNCEHLIDAAADFAGWMLEQNPRVKILATSREPLRITGEVLWPVAPLAEDASVQLLGDRAAAVRPGFAVNESNSDVVSRICRALDGMPLAIELAAARLRLLSPDQLAERLDDRFAVLTGGSRSALPRHQTLRAVVEWSWESLSKPERILARRLAVFPGGVTLEAAEGVCADESLPAGAILEALSGLVDKSILVAGTGTRYRMLETIRAYGEERLAEAGEDQAVRAEFRRHYVTLAETADPLLRGPEQNRWLTELDAELDNVHAAIRLAIEARDTVQALRFIQALGWYWMIRSNGESESIARMVLGIDVDAVRADFEVAVRRLNECFSLDDHVHPLAAFAEPMLALHDRQPERALTLFDSWGQYANPWESAALTLMRAQTCAMLGRTTEAEELLVEAVGTFRAFGDGWMLAAALSMIADFAAMRGDRRAAMAANREAADVSDYLGAPIDRGHFDSALAGLAIRDGDLPTARKYLGRAAERDEDQRDMRLGLDLIRAELAWAEGDFAATARGCQEVDARLENKTSVWWRSFRGTVSARHGLAMLRLGDPGRARELLGEALRAASEWVEQPDLAKVFDSIGVLALDDGDPALAATLLGAGHTLRGQFDESSLDAPGARREARQALGEDGYDAAYQRGRDLTPDQAVALAGTACGAQARRR
ncbi:MAG: BTAD domain-containing putative transcriptional regulator [Streptosporangiaceae bacterium]